MILAGRNRDDFQLLEAFDANRTVTDLVIAFGFQNIPLEGAAMGKITFRFDHAKHGTVAKAGTSTATALGVKGVRAFQPALRANRTLKQMDLPSCCGLDNECIHLLADALASNTTMDALNVKKNDITSVCFDDITRLLESTQLKTINVWNYSGIFNDQSATLHFVSTLQQNKSTVQELPMFYR